MSSKIALENNEDLENVQLVRMEDVQPPPKDRNTDNEMYKDDRVEFVIDEEDPIGEVVYIDGDDIKCEDSNEVVIGDWVSEDCSNDEAEISLSESKAEETKITRQPQDSWPILEILPGGIIKNGDRLGTNSHLCDDVTFDNSELLYACAKCPEKFKSLFYLGKHINWHEAGKKKHMLEVKPIQLSANKVKCKKQTVKRLSKKS